MSEQNKHEDVEKQLEKYLTTTTNANIIDNNNSDVAKFNFSDDRIPTTNSSASFSKKEFDMTKASDLQYFTFDISELPCGYFYPVGTTILVRAAEVKEIQAYSMVDDQNIFDVYDKLNDIISACIKIKYPNGTIGSYLELKDNDRFYLIFVIRDLTFQKANALNLEVSCEHCSTQNTISLSKNSFSFYSLEECSLHEYFDRSEKLFVFETVNGNIIKLGIPSIGLQKSFFTYIAEQPADKKKTLSASFLKIIPYMISERKTITEEGIKKLLLDFQSMDNDTFQFLNAAVEDIKFGIKNIVTVCKECREEVHSEFTFPNGASRLFVLDKRKAIDGFIKKK